MAFPEMSQEGQLPENILPPNNDGGINSAINQAGALEGVNSSTEEPIVNPYQSDIDFINNKVASQAPETEIGAQGVSALFPGINQPIRVGGYSGSIVGQNDLFAAGGNIFPTDVTLARRKKIEDAAAQEAARKAKPFELRRAKELKDKRFQTGINDQARSLQEEYINKAKELFGENYREALQNPQETEIGRNFISKMDALDVMVSEGNQVTDLIAGIKAGTETGEKFYTEDTLKLVDDFEQLVGDFENASPSELAGFRDKLNKLNGYNSLDNYLNDNKHLTNLKGRIAQSAGVKDFNEYLRTGTHKTKKFDKDINVLAKQLAQKEFLPQVRAGVLTEQEIADHMKAIMGSEDIRDVKVNMKPKGSGRQLSAADASKPSGASKKHRLFDSSGQEYSINTNKGGTTALPQTNKSIDLTSLNIANQYGGTLEAGFQEAVPLEINSYNDSEGNPKAGMLVRIKDKKEYEPSEGEDVNLEVLESNGYSIEGGKAYKEVDREVMIDLDENTVKTLEANGSTFNVESGGFEKAYEKALKSSSSKPKTRKREDIEGF